MKTTNFEEMGVYDFSDLNQEQGGTDNCYNCDAATGGCDMDNGGGTCDTDTGVSG